MRFRCCQMLLNHLVFAQSTVIPCCCSPVQRYDTKFFNEYNGDQFDIDEYAKQRNHYIDIFKQGKEPECCQGCPLIEEKEWNEEISFSNIIVTNRTYCSCNCIYCSLLENNPVKKQELNTRVPYDVKPILTDMKNKNLIKPGCNFMIAGGECTEYPDNELEWLLDFAKNSECKLEILSSGIKYSEDLENALRTASTRLRISPDTAIKETYEKIKRVNAYDIVWQNIEKYITATKNNPEGFVELKYIILPGINDNIEEAKAFIEKSKSIGCKIVLVTIEYEWLKNNKDNPVSKDMSDVIRYFVEINENSNENFELRFEPQVEYWFRKNYKKVYKCCEYMLHQIVFDQDDTKPCCSETISGNGTKFIEQYDGQLISPQEYSKKRDSYLQLFKSGRIPDCCTGCPMIEEKAWDENLYFERIIIAHISKCSCNCIYCVYTYNDPEKKKYYNTRKHYDIKPILTDLKEKNLIKENCEIIVGGGECAEFPRKDLEWILNFTKSTNCKILLLSSGITYSDAISKMLKSGKAEIIISPDAGTKATYEKIKRVKAFDRVYKHIKKYVDSARKNPQARVVIKYIIIPGINDNITELHEFVKKCKQTGCKNIQLDIEHHWFNEHKDELVPEGIKTCAEFFKSLDEFDFTFCGETHYWFIEKLGFKP